eukprot:SAG31_NODE_11452_length_1028_cov_1.413348_2_plen_97_part_00
MCSQFAACISGSPSHSHSDDVETILKRSLVSYGTVQSDYNDSISVCDSEFVSGTVCGTVPFAGESMPSFSLRVRHDSSQPQQRHLGEHPVDAEQFC